MGLDQLLNMFLHIDIYLEQALQALGPWLYLILFLVIFCETGLIVLPFLPGDSLLFAAGALTMIPNSPLSLWPLMALLISAAILGDGVNYLIGRWAGPRVFKYESSRLLNTKHLKQAQSFYAKYGAKTIVIARFVPIVRTFAPFVAGMGKMHQGKFTSYNVSGAILWVGSLATAGHYFGHLPFVKENFKWVIVAIIVISVLPIFWELGMHRRHRRRGEIH